GPARRGRSAARAGAATPRPRRHRIRGSAARPAGLRTGAWSPSLSARFALHPLLDRGNRDSHVDAVSHHAREGIIHLLEPLRQRPDAEARGVEPAVYLAP